MKPPALVTRSKFVLIGRRMVIVLAREDGHERVSLFTRLNAHARETGWAYVEERLILVEPWM